MAIMMFCIVAGASREEKNLKEKKFLLSRWM